MTPRSLHRNSLELRYSEDSSSYLPLAILASLLAHILIALALGSSQDIRLYNAQPIMIDVLQPAPVAEKSPSQEKVTPKQFVETPDAPESASDVRSRLLSSQDTAVQREQLKRGSDPDAGTTGERSTQPQQRPSAPSENRQSEQNRAAPRKTEQVMPLQKRLSSSNLLSALSSPPDINSAPRDRTQQDSDAERSDNENYQAFNRSPGDGARFFGTRGSSDFIPDLPDGDITLLNTKANQYAVFVRRVALEVFRNLKASGLLSLSHVETSAASRFVTIRAIMNSKGELVSIALDESSGSSRFDSILEDSVRRGARDPNPPASAALKDGNIHFVFQSKVWSRVVQDPRMGAREQKWVLLSTGLL